MVERWSVGPDSMTQNVDEGTRTWAECWTMEGSETVGTCGAGLIIYAYAYINK